MAKIKSHQGWSWILLIMFLLLSILDIRFGLLGFICMSAPIYHALRGKGKIHCSKYCPRGSLLGKFLQRLSFENELPLFMKGKKAKNTLLGLMLFMFSLSLYHAGFDSRAIGFAVFRLMTVSLIFGMIMGIIYKPRSWCIVCPMGHATGLIRDFQNQNNREKKANQNQVA
ncbi:4Fe-4S ferredoxin [Geosporobacter ferrireducens]|uniref:4Fe-4S ferredoxin n=1 Tax=Geosporobacter ferrireducens TaxID=1424294 RepID=A0A1D8GKB1_9FIRM|nr:4Fe-4S ferredoxin [Geosporobacter ferrireducens]AOT71350.1 4Fe-4S ferredoxin [Geosporobacter ferrireducens]MTI57664.1 4Fe-4S ferredoxin [Geosporobacter ferrireducens]